MEINELHGCIVERCIVGLLSLEGINVYEITTC